MVVTVSLKGQEYLQAIQAILVGVAVELLSMAQANFKGKSSH